MVIGKAVIAPGCCYRCVFYDEFEDGCSLIIEGVSPLMVDEDNIVCDAYKLREEEDE